jgi:hypothetical protein
VAMVVLLSMTSTDSSSIVYIVIPHIIHFGVCNDSGSFRR